MAWPTPGCFDDVRVLEVGDEKGEYCGRLLSGEGAAVIKVEPLEGSPTRRIGPFLRDEPHPDRSLFFWMYNRGKRGITLDLATVEGRAAYLQLVEGAHVVIDAQGPGVMTRLSLGYEQVRAINPTIVYCAITPFGLTGPWRDFEGSDLVHMALGGSAHCIGYDPVEPAEGRGSDPIFDTPPFMPQTWHSYCVAGQHAAMAVAAALLYRQMTGEGQFIDVSVHDACAQSTEGTVPRYIYNGVNSPRRLPNMALCRDGTYVTFILVPPANLGLLAARLSADGFGAELGEVDVLNDVVKRWASSRSSGEVFSALQACRAIAAPVYRPEDLVNDPQAIDREDFVEIQHPELGESFTYPRHPRRQQTTPYRWGPRAPLLGEHNDEIL